MKKLMNDRKQVILFAYSLKIWPPDLMMDQVNLFHAAGVVGDVDGSKMVQKLWTELKCQE